MTSTTSSRWGNVGQLNEIERSWRDLQPWLKEQGYELRKRFHPDWVPSWANDETLIPTAQEDGAGNLHLGMDAVRVADGKVVYLKKVEMARQNPENEMEMLQRFSSPPLKGHRENHAVPFLGQLTTPDGDTLTIVPLLVFWFAVPYTTVGEVLDFVHQTCEGLQFIHAQRIAHCDVKINNILMDGLHLYESRPHPALRTFSMDTKKKLKMFRRTRKPAKYYYIDFEMSTYYPPDVEPVKQVGYGGEHTVPEFKKQETCNPFQVDVYCLGMMIKRFIHGAKTMSVPHGKPMLGFGFLDPLLDDMSHEDPEKRPTMDQVMGRLHVLEKSLSFLKLRSRVVYEGEPKGIRIRRNILHCFHFLSDMILLRPAIPGTPSS